MSITASIVTAAATTALLLLGLYASMQVPVLSNHVLGVRGLADQSLIGEHVCIL